MTLNIFTHNTRNPTIDIAIRSFNNTFGEYPTLIWRDGANTTGLSDGYIQAIESCPDDYIFMLEHDWEFIQTPDHRLPLIIEKMKADGIVHLRFNKRANEPVNADSWLKDMGWYCETPFVSNNPHIIDRIAYLGFLKNGWIKSRRRSFGIEEVISRHINGTIYGGIGYPAVVKHLRGR